MRWVCAHVVVVAASVLWMGATTARADEKREPKSIWQQETLTGDWGGARSALKDKNGIDISLTYINEVLGVFARRHQKRGQL